MADGPLIEPRASMIAPHCDRAFPPLVARCDRVQPAWQAGIPSLRVIRAETPELRRIAYRLRYDVYCVENSFLDPGQYPDRLETDEFDDQSLHALLQHTPSGDYIGTVRLIMPVLGEGRPTMPFAQLCREPRVRRGEIVPLASTAEVSRFAISKSFRRRLSDGAFPDQFAPRNATAIANERRVMPSLSLGLITAVAQMGLESGISHVCAVMEPALLRLLKRLGVEFDPLGPAVEYHGVRQPCYAQAATLLRQIREARPDYWDRISGTGQSPSPLAPAAL